MQKSIFGHFLAKTWFFDYNFFNFCDTHKVFRSKLAHSIDKKTDKFSLERFFFFDTSFSPMCHFRIFVTFWKKRVFLIITFSIFAIPIKFFGQNLRIALIKKLTNFRSSNIFFLTRVLHLCVILAPF